MTKGRGISFSGDEKKKVKKLSGYHHIRNTDDTKGGFLDSFPLKK